MLRRTEIGESTITLEQAKGYMRYTGTTKDDEVKSTLLTAIRRIEDIQNVSLRPMIVQLIITDPNDFNSLYLHPVAEVVSVKDAISGNEIGYSLNHSKSKVKVATAHDVVVEYRTAETSDIKDYTIAVLAFTALMFDGLTQDEAYRKIFHVYLTPKFL